MSVTIDKQDFDEGIDPNGEGSEYLNSIVESPHQESSTESDPELEAEICSQFYQRIISVLTSSPTDAISEEESIKKAYSEMAHDINNKLTVIQAYIDLFRIADLQFSIEEIESAFRFDLDFISLKFDIMSNLCRDFMEEFHPARIEDFMKRTIQLHESLNVQMENFHRAIGDKLIYGTWDCERVNESAESIQSSFEIILRLLDLHRSVENNYTQLRNLMYKLTLSVRALVQLNKITLKITDQSTNEAGVIIDLQEVLDALLEMTRNSIYSINLSGRKKGRIEIKVSSFPTEEFGDYYLIDFRDNGAGVDDKVADKLFKSTATTKPRGKGSGKGLKGVSTTLEKYGGHIFHDPNFTEGARFCILLPQVKDPASVPSL